MEASSIIKSLSKYLYKNIDNSYSHTIDSRYATVRFTALYAVPDEIIDMYDLPEEYGETYEMNIEISFAPYSDGFRMELIELAPDARTIAFSKFSSKTFTNPQKDFKKVYDKIFKILEKEFKNYDFIY